MEKDESLIVKISHFFLTSNLGDHVITAYADKPDELEDALYPELTTFFKPALLCSNGSDPLFTVACRGFTTNC